MTHGIHHVTAIAGSARRNIEFYTRVLGLRLVKKTVNFDDPGTYHLYYGDETGRPGSLLTFFSWEHAAPGRLGVGETQETVLRVPEGSIGYWMHRFIEKGVTHEAPQKRFGETVLSFKDADGMRLALAAVPGIEAEPAWIAGSVSVEHAVRGLHGVSLLIEEAGPTSAIVTDVLGFREMGREGSTIRFVAPGASMGAVLDLRAVGGFLKPRNGRGTVHHVAFRASDEAAQAAMVRKLTEEHGLVPTEIKDRNYFRSVYFEEPGHVLFEIATDAPGFAVDEALEELGSSLKLPAIYEPRRAWIEAQLPFLDDLGGPSAFEAPEEAASGG